MMADENKETLFEPLGGKTFKFRCHKNITCFTLCCADLTLVLTPYDIVRLKNRLGLSSEDFLEKFSKTEYDRRSRFPRVILKMDPNSKKCPFVTPDGCSVYHDRPGACRIYPLGRAALKVNGERDTREKYFTVKEPHCLGFQEDREWDIEEWMKNEGLDEYNALNDQWLEIISSRKGMGADNMIEKKMQMFSMASYNLDKFRSFIFRSKFFQLFDIDEHTKKELESDDIKLLIFAVKWLKFSLFGEKTLQTK